MGFAGKASAQNGQPHTLSATTNFNKVSLQWESPTSAIELKWHDGSSYNGMDGKQSDPQKEIVFYAGARFTPSELANYAGLQVDSIAYFEYRNVEKVNIQVYEDGVLKVDTKAPIHKFTKNSWNVVALDAPYTIPSGKTVIFSVKYIYGYNQDLVANTDRYPTRGKGNIYSYDGKKWYDNGVGDFMITAKIKNNATKTPDGYNVYRDNQKINTELVSSNSYTIDNETGGTHIYNVSAVYGSDELKSANLQVNVNDFATMAPPASTFTGKTNELSGQLQWTAPLQTANELTWSNKINANSIGGTSTSSPKVWVAQEFDANDLTALKDYQITSIKSYLTEKAITSAKVFVMKDGKIDYYEDVADSIIAAITAGSWATYKLTKPYVLTPGSTYKYGVYYTHTKSAHPIGVDSSTAIDNKGNIFSTSSPRSSNFADSSPSWKTLSSGNIAGNLMLSADVEPVGTATEKAVFSGYDLYRNDVLIAKDLKATSFADNVDEPGTYTYRLATKYEGALTAAEKQIILTYTLPESYSAPIITKQEFNDSSKQVDIAWSSTVLKMQKYGTATYMASFPEELTMKFGAKFGATEIGQYAGYEIRDVKFGVGEEVDTFAIQIIDGKGNILSSDTLKKGDIDALALYTMTISKPVTIEKNTDYYVVYSAKIPAKNGMMLLDKGPLQEGGAMINLGGNNWLQLGTIATDFNNYNIVIGATAYASASGAKSKAVKLCPNGHIIDDVIDLGSYGISVDQSALTEKPKRAAAQQPQVASYNVYRNDELVKNTTEKEFSEVLNHYGVFNYYVTAVYSNGWESPKSEVFTVTNTIAQKAQAPYDLNGVLDNTTFKLTWKPASDATVLSYAAKDNANFAFGMTGSGTRESYCAIKFAPDTLSNFAGKNISHITFRIADTELKTASVFVIKHSSIVYEQTVPVSSLVVGDNAVRLDTPFKIEDDGSDLYIGYHVTYTSGIKPLVMDTMNCVPFYSDLISSTAGDEYWYSCNTRFGAAFGHNWRISATLATSDINLKVKKAAAVTTYNVYRDGIKIADGIENTSFDVENALSGSYTVTAMNGDSESAESNAVILELSTGIKEVSSQVSDGKNYPLYNLAGQRVGNDYHGIVVVNGKKYVK